MSRKSVRAAHTAVLACLFLFAVLSFHRVRYAVSSSRGGGVVDGGDRFRGEDGSSSSPPSIASTTNPHRREIANYAARRHVSSVVPDSFTTDSILWPDWQVLVVVSADRPADDQYSCLYQNNITSPARPAWVLPSTNQTAFICELPEGARRGRVLLQPALIRSPEKSSPPLPAPPPPRELMLWNFLIYESFSTADDVVLFAKGVNHRQGQNRPPSELKCVFFDGGHVAAKTAVTVSAQEVFRCHHTPRSALPSGDGAFKVSIEVGGTGDGNVVVPTVAQYAPTRRSRPGAAGEKKALICACTMVFNAAKYLKEWVMYHSSIGMERFILYDNGSEDDLGKVVEELKEEKYDVRRVLWPWQKAQEAGFSHCALHARDSCTWMSFIDVDEFIFSPSWLNFSHPSTRMLKSLLPRTARSPSSGDGDGGRLLGRPVGEVSIQCNEFGPSGQRVHPEGGVTQGYTCRRRQEQRHKSIVRLDAVHPSLLNVIHHFQVKEGYRTKRLGPEKAVVNHYKYQAWSEFKAKFRRRVSAYVVDWREAVNPGSKDRTPGLGFQAVEPRGWPNKFCELRDDRLKNATDRWFGSPAGLAWQR